MINISTYLEGAGAGAGAGKTLRTQEFTSSGTWVRPAGVEAVFVLAVGGGAGGGSAQSEKPAPLSKRISFAIGAGGNGGGIVEKPMIVSSNLTITIGAGGSKGVVSSSQASVAAGGAGSDTVVSGTGETVTAYGGEANASGYTTSIYANISGSSSSTHSFIGSHGAGARGSAKLPSAQYIDASSSVVKNNHTGETHCYYPLKPLANGFSKTPLLHSLTANQGFMHGEGSRAGKGKHGMGGGGHGGIIVWGTERPRVGSDDVDLHSPTSELIASVDGGSPARYAYQSKQSLYVSNAWLARNYGGGGGGGATSCGADAAVNTLNIAHGADGKDGFVRLVWWE